MLYCITYDIKNNTNEEAFIKELKLLGEVNQFISNCWFLRSNKDKNEIFSLLKSQMDTPDLLFITTTSVSQMEGWLPTTSIGWLKEHSNK